MARMPNIPKNVKHRPKGLVDCAQITDLLIFPGQERRPLYDQIRGFLKDGYLWPVAREEQGKKAFLMQPDHILIADVLLRLREFGIKGPEHGPYDAAALALRDWKGRKPDGAESSPAAHVIREYEMGVEGWVFELWSFLNPKSGSVTYEGRIHSHQRMQATDLLNGGSSALVNRGCFAVDLTDALDRIHPRGKAKCEALN
ncbi:MAG: hypothetical protein VYA97_14300 [Pseudomonadota bacterium]|nr:hypothetical protein [Pseudomonadota bacterium]